MQTFTQEEINTEPKRLGKSMSRVLLVEDEADIRDLMEIQLQSKGHEITTCDNGDDAIDLIQSQNFDLFILDRMLPGTQGTDICKFIRNFKNTKHKPILIVTALASSDNIVEGLEAGADDYVTKPFEMDIFKARVKSLIRRAQLTKEIHETKESNIIKFGELKIDLDQCIAWSSDQLLNLTASEYRLLCHLVKNSRKVLNRRDLVQFVQGGEVHVTDRTIDTHIFGLRKKLGSNSSMIETIRGIGYRVNANE